MSKTHIYFVPGMAANSKIFEHLSLDKNLFECHYLEWKIPTSKDESIQSYAQRMCEEIKHKDPVLIGVSFVAAANLKRLGSSKFYFILDMMIFFFFEMILRIC